jgi:uncharacterized membrane protein YphA (DoxX/SURF4 family)
MNEFNPRDRSRRIDEGFEPQHRSGAGLDRPMIRLDNIVQILAGSDLQLHWRRIIMYYDASWLDAAGRLLIVVYFLVSGVQALRPEQRKHHVGLLGGFHVPFPTVAYWVGMALIWTGCVLLLTGWHADIGIYCLLAFTVAANAIYNRFWTVQNPMQRDFTRMLLCANTAVMGGLLLVLENLQ